MREDLKLHVTGISLLKEIGTYICVLFLKFFIPGAGADYFFPEPSTLPRPGTISQIAPPHLKSLFFLIGAIRSVPEPGGGGEEPAGGGERPGAGPGDGRPHLLIRRGRGGRGQGRDHPPHPAPGGAQLLCMQAY